MFRSKSVPRIATETSTSRQRNPYNTEPGRTPNLQMNFGRTDSTVSSVPDFPVQASYASSIASNDHSYRGSSLSTASESRGSLIGALSLASLQKSQLTVRAYLQKYNSASQKWNQRFFVLSDDCKLHMYPVDLQESLPFSILPVEGFIIDETEKQHRIMRVFGESIAFDGTSSMSQWILKFPDESIFNLWTRSITINTGVGGTKKFKAFMKNSTRTSLDSRSGSFGHTPPRRSQSQGRIKTDKPIVMSEAPVSKQVNAAHEVRALEMHQKYQEYLLAAQKKFMAPDAIQKRRHEAKLVAEAEREKIAKERAEAARKKNLASKADVMRDVLGI
ncbi:hypothetical protein HK100_005584 [Physocladia obscura]|uniref:PH domain-containing protein n=1 Tax=Physocladia obscura TaxID=109957 RepID=A0AAD5X997_9FUNG|nr:hypothetical protein HK100_005584 [Physocladia obscura]